MNQVEIHFSLQGLSGYPETCVIIPVISENMRNNYKPGIENDLFKETIQKVCSIRNAY